MTMVQELRQLFRVRLLQLAALAALFILIVAICFVSKTYILDPDIWWHLKVGDWIVAHNAVPFTGILSRTAAARSWVAYSWAFEVLLSRAYAWFGLIGFALFSLLLTLAVAAALFAAVFVLSRRFWTSWFLTLVGVFAHLYSLYPRPVFCTMILFTIMLCMVLKAQRNGSVRILYWLPLLFLLWANLHIQFIYGLATIGLYIVIDATLRLAAKVGLHAPKLCAPSLPLAKLMLIFAGCLVASCIGPYSYRLYVVVFEYSRAQATYSVIQELQSVRFDGVTSFTFLFVVMAGFYAVGWKKKLDLFQLLLLVVGSLCAFRTMRDIWFASIPAILFLADAPVDERKASPAFRPTEIAGVIGAIVFMMFLLAGNLGFSTRGLDRDISREYPVDAVNYLRRIHPPGPLYNDFDWGGFLTWYLPEYPVSIDGRNDLYGDKEAARYIDFGNGDHTDGDPSLDEAGIVLLDKDQPLAKLLKGDPRFRLVYEDRLASLFLRN